MPEEIEKTEEALQTATFKTKAVVEQLTKGDVKGIWEKLWESLQGEIWHFGKIVLLAVVIFIIAYFVSKLIHKAFNKVAEKYAIDVSLVSIINRIITLMMLSSVRPSKGNVIKLSSITILYSLSINKSKVESFIFSKNPGWRTNWFL